MRTCTAPLYCPVNHVGCLSAAAALRTNQLVILFCLPPAAFWSVGAPAAMCYLFCRSSLTWHIVRQCTDGPGTTVTWHNSDLAQQ
jgi:hypothetical protein